jgi:uncharacterized membrane protein YfcA
VTLSRFLLLIVAGIGAGLVGSVAGMASLISYPALLASGLAPVTANVTNTVALIFQGVGAIHGSAPELRGARQRQLVRRLAAWALLGGILGGVLLLRTPSDAFARIVPWLIGGAALAVLIRPRAPAVDHPAREPWALRAGVFLAAVYGGYFGAAAGVILLALLLALTGESLAHSSAVRSVLLFSANGVAALYFIAVGDVHWLSVLPLALGLVTGARIGPTVLRRAPAGPIRALIAVTGLGLALYLGYDAYT